VAPLFLCQQALFGGQRIGPTNCPIEQRQRFYRGVAPGVGFQQAGFRRFEISLFRSMQDKQRLAGLDMLPNLV